MDTTKKDNIQHKNILQNHLPKWIWIVIWLLLYSLIIATFNIKPINILSWFVGLSLMPVLLILITNVQKIFKTIYRITQNPRELILITLHGFISGLIIFLISMSIIMHPKTINDHFVKYLNVGFESKTSNK